MVNSSELVCKVINIFVFFDEIDLHGICSRFGWVANFWLISKILILEFNEKLETLTLSLSDT